MEVSIASLVVLSLALAVLAVALVIRVSFVPALALILYVVIPNTTMPGSGIFGAVPPMTFVLVIWMVRRAFTRGPGYATPGAALSDRRLPARTSARVLALLAFGWFSLTLVESPYRQNGVGWLISFTVAVLLPIFCGDARAEARALKTTWTVLGAAIGAYAMVEALLRDNFLFGVIYRLVGRPSIQHWSVYRAEASLGHPLFLGTFLSVAVVLAISQWLQGGDKRFVVWALLAAGGVAATVSRGALIATVAAVGFCFVYTLVGRSKRSWIRIVGLVVIVAFALWGVSQFSSILERGTSAEAGNSTSARDSALAFVLGRVSQGHWFGSGAGTSSVAAAALGFYTPIENSALQLLVSVGVVGTILFFALIAVSVLTSLRNGDLPAGAALVVYLIAILGYNALDERRSMHLFLGLLVLMALNPSPHSDESIDSKDDSRLRQKTDISTDIV